jgi:fucose 4-O-acetylase-like acetyltransferase
MQYKDSYFQFLRAICIIAIIAIHSLDFSKPIDSMTTHFGIVLRQFIKFPMLLFLFISAYFSRNDGGQIKSRLNRFLSIFFVMDCHI